MKRVLQILKSGGRILLKIGLLGCGGMGLKHADCYAALKDVAQVVAVADLDSEKADKAAEILDAKVYKSATELLDNEKPDIIDVCLPTFLHAEYALIAMEKGCNVFMEKPVCLNMDEAKSLLEMQKKKGVKVQVGHVIRFWNEYVWVKNALVSGKYGKIKSASFRRLSPKPVWGWKNWFSNYELSGTVVQDLHIHDADFVRYLMGEPENVNAYATRDDDGVIQGIMAVYQYGDALITAESAWDFPEKYPFCADFQVKFERATAVLDKNGLTVYPIDGEPFSPDFKSMKLESSDSNLNVSGSDAYYNELRHFIELVEKGNDSEIAPLSEGVKTLELIEKEIKLVGGRKK